MSSQQQFFTPVYDLPRSVLLRPRVGRLGARLRSSEPRKRRPRSLGRATPRRVLQIITPSRMSGAEMQLVRLTRRMEELGEPLGVQVLGHFIVSPRGVARV